MRSTFRILEELSRLEALGLREITLGTGIPKSTVFRILSTLLELGYVVRDGDRNYRVSVALGRMRGAFPACLEDFLYAVLDNTTPRVTGLDGRQVTATLEAIHKSLESGNTESVSQPSQVDAVPDARS